jgi:hypothetical protein
MHVSTGFPNPFANILHSNGQHYDHGSYDHFGDQQALGGGWCAPQRIVVDEPLACANPLLWPRVAEDPPLLGWVVFSQRKETSRWQF